MKKLMAVVTATALSLTLAACGGQNSLPAAENNRPAEAAPTTPATPAAPAEQQVESITVSHVLGETTVPKQPQRVVVFDFGILDSLDQLQIPVAGLPKSNLPDYLNHYADSKYANVGSLMEPDFEKIHALDPDVIFISARQQDLYDEFTAIAPTVYVTLDSQRYLESFAENTKLLGEIFAKSDQVEAELARIKAQITELHDLVAASGSSALITLVNEGAISAYGPGSRFGQIHDAFGFAPADPSIEVSTHGQSVSFEYLREQNPDYLFVVDRGAVVGGQAGARQVMENELTKDMKAFQSNRVVYLNPHVWYLSGGGLISVAEMVREVRAAVAP